MNGSAAKKILIIDDEETNVILLKALFRSDNFEITVARDGEEGLNLAKSLVPDLILLDVMMPKVDGFKVCGLLKNDSRFDKIPVFILSSRAGDDDVELSRQVGADTYMLKPINKQELAQRIEEKLGWSLG